jgi:hypothetical protein
MTADPAAKFVVHDLLAINEIHLIFGPARSGKTTLALQMFDDFCAGRPVLGFPSSPMPTCFVACERSAASLAAAIARVGIDASLPHLSLAGRLKREEYNIEAAYSLAKAKVPELRVLFFDGFSRLCPGKWYDDRDVSQFLIDSTVFCHERHLTIIGTLPCVKAKEGNGYQDPLERISGSGCWSSGTDFKLMIERYNPKDVTNCYRTMTLFPAHRAESRMWAGFSQGRIQLLNDPPTTVNSPGTPIANLEEHYAMTQDDSTISVQDAIERYDIPRRTLQRWLQEKVKEGKLVRVGRGLYRKSRIT